jgi:hypothetical protein
LRKTKAAIGTLQKFELFARDQMVRAVHDMFEMLAAAKGTSLNVILVHEKKSIDGAPLFTNVHNSPH